MTFNNLQLIEPLLKALSNEGYTTPTPVQEQSIPVILQGRDLFSCAQTGTGKTAAFAIPLLQLLHQAPTSQEARRPVRALILTPTRELAIQVNESFAAYGKYLSLKHFAIFGGVSQYHQVKALRQGMDILIATPGRLLDLLQQHQLSLRHLEFFVLDEADRMLDMGFINDMKKIIDKLPAQRQTIFFSATMPPEIQMLSATLLHQPVKVEVTPDSATVDRIQQKLYYVEKQNKRSLLIHLLKDESISTALIFTTTKHGADRIAKDLNKAGVGAQVIHGNKSQNERQSALQHFKTGRTRVLVATDIASRGIDIDNMGLVINYELPNTPETYVHRIGRTGRAGAEGIAVSFCDFEEKMSLKDIQRLINKIIPVVKGHPFDVPLMHGIEQLASQTTANPAMRRGKKKGRTFSQQRA